MLEGIWQSETLDFVADEGVQIHGGNGYSDEYIISKAYRDSRINRIYEGTNEINRLLTVDMVLKRAMKGRLDIMAPAMAVSKELMSIPDFSASDEGPFLRKRKKRSPISRRRSCWTAGAAVQKLMAKIEGEQEVMMNIADMAIETFVAESALLRAEKLVEQRGEAACAFELDIARTLYIRRTPI